MADALVRPGLHDTLAKGLLTELRAGTQLSLSYCVMKGTEAGYSPENVRAVVDALIQQGLVSAIVPRCGLSSPTLVAVSDALARYERSRANADAPHPMPGPDHSAPLIA